MGASSALNIVAAYDLAKKLGPGHTIVTVICDGGIAIIKYLDLHHYQSLQIPISTFQQAMAAK